jgi:LemA protein
MNPSFIIIGIVILALVVIALWMVGIYNRLVKNKNLMSEAWSGIDVQLKRRHDLIPNLVKTVEGYSQHEKGLFENIAKARSQSISTTNVQAKAEAENQISQGLRQLFAVAEAYPELKANQNFMDLQSQLGGVEDQLQLARRYYNGTVREYNVLVGSFPSSIIASQFQYTPAPYFEIDSADRTVPEVNFSRPS